MQRKRVIVVWVLLLGSVVLLGGATTMRWYGLSADSPFVGSQFFDPGAGTDIDAPPYGLHTEFWLPLHQDDFITGQGGSTAGYESAPAVSQTLEPFRVLYLTGFAGMAVALVGLLLRMYGVTDGRGLIGTVATVSLLMLAGSIVFFSVNIADAYNQELEQGTGESPQAAFITLGIDAEGDTWTNVTSGPRLGWYSGVLGIGAGAAAFGMVYATDLRRAREIITDDEAAAAQYARSTAEREHVVDRIRQEGRS